MASIGNGLPITPVEQTTTSSAEMPSARAVAAAIARASSMPLAPVQALALPGVDDDGARAPVGQVLPREHDRRRGQAAARERPGGHCGAVARHERQVGRARVLDAAGHAGGPEAARKADADAVFHRHTPSPSAVRPAPSSRPSTRLAFWSACPPAPLTRLSIAAAQIAVCVRSSIQTARWQLLAP